VPRAPARLKPLPAPDFLESTLTSGYSCLLTDDGTPLTARLAQALSELGWPVVVLSFPGIGTGQPALPATVGHVRLHSMDEAHLTQTLQALAASHGPVGALLHLHPAHSGAHNGEFFPAQEKALLQHIFLAARELKPSLNEAARQGRGYFVTVARLDGTFGMSAEADFSAVGGGLFGLTKTLNLEWEPVFCRAIDLSPQVEPTAAVQHILAELHDPNRLISEVGYSSQGRTTLMGL
jgi:NAD(P)-dependent dehydrogenase (short-subunit alcohol dehydrogenase family)